MSFRHCVAVDLGASSGRVMLAGYQPGQQTLALREIHRFTNNLQKVDGFDCWDLDSLEGEIRQVQTIGSHLVYLVEIRNITLSQQGHGLIYFKRRFHPVMMEMDVVA